MMKSSCRHVSLLMMMIIMVVALSSASSLEGLFNLPCCNTCPPPPVNIVPVYVEKEIVVNIPFPVLKPYPSQFFPNGTCPDGFVRPTSSSNKCVRSIRVEDNVKCPEGYFRVGDNTCVRVYIANNEDTLGQIIDKVVCPPGYIQPEDGSIACMHAETNETVSAPENIEDPLQCPEGYLRVTPWRCVKVVSCPTEGGFTVTEDGRCMRTRIDCPEGYKLLGRTQCIREELNCPTGYEYNNNTHSCDKIVYVTRCPDGQVDVNGVCKHPDCVTTECSPEVQCQKGYVWQKKNPTDCCAQCSPCVCSASFEPVCTSDNVTYPNYCVANCLKAEVKHLGACGSSDRKDDCTVDTTFVDWRPKIVCPDGYTFNAEEKSCTLVSTSTSSQTTVTTKVDKKVRPLKEIIVKALEKQQQEQSAPATESNTLSNTQTHRSRDTLHTVNTLEFEMLY